MYLIEKYDAYYTCIYTYDICDKYDQYGLYIWDIFCIYDTFNLPDIYDIHMM